jgi:nucleotide-binding universal stress UspA family protein
MATLQSILLATDFRESSQAAARAVVQLATTFGAQVRVLHVREEFITWPVSPFENQDRLTAELKAQNVDLAEFLVHAGPAADVVVRTVREVNADLLVIGTGEKNRDGHLVLGPIAESILEHAPAPILAVNPHGPKLAFKTIVCPVDHSEVSRRALEDAMTLARAYSARLIVVSVVPDVSWLEAAVETGQIAGAKLEHESKWIADLDQFLGSMSLDGLDWEREVRYGNPHEQILAAAQERLADLLVVGATGRSGLVRMLLGSTTRRLMRQLPCSLLIVKDHTVFEEQFLADITTIERLVAEGQKWLVASSPMEAAGKFRQALVLDPYHYRALAGLASACDQIGDSVAARRYRTRAERLQQREG